MRTSAVALALLAAWPARAGELATAFGFPFDDERVLSSGAAPSASGQGALGDVRRILELSSLDRPARRAIEREAVRLIGDRPARYPTAIPKDVDLDGASFLAGAAETDITPRGELRGCPLGGTGSRHKKVPLSPDPEWMDPSDLARWQFPSLGIHDPIRVKALVLSDGRERVALVGVDSVGVSERFAAALGEALEPIGLGRSNLILTATHNHSGPGALADEPWYWFTATDFFSRALFDRTVRETASTVARAAGRLVPARVRIATCRDREGLSRNLRGRPETIDPEIGTLAVEDGSGRAISFLFTFAMHVNAIREGMVSPFFSADISGAAEREIENAFEAGGRGRPVAIFVNGAEGDVDPVARGYAAMERDGQKLGRQARECVAGGRAEAGLRLSIRNSVLRYPDEPSIRPWLVDRRFPRDLTIPMGSLVTRRGWVQAIRLNDVGILTVPGEPIAEIGLRLKQSLRARGFGAAWVFGLANGYMAYTTTREEYWKGGYQAAATLFGPGQADHLERELSALADRLPVKHQ